MMDEEGWAPRGPVTCIIKIRRGEVLFGTIGMVFRGLSGLGAGLSFLRPLLIPGQSAMDGYWSAGTSVIFFLLMPSMLHLSRLMAVGLAVIGTALLLPGLTPACSEPPRYR